MHDLCQAKSKPGCNFKIQSNFQFPSKCYIFTLNFSKDKKKLVFGREKLTLPTILFCLFPCTLVHLHPHFPPVNSFTFLFHDSGLLPCKMGKKGDAKCGTYFLPLLLFLQQLSHFLPQVRQYCFVQN